MEANFQFIPIPFPQLNFHFLVLSLIIIGRWNFSFVGRSMSRSNFNLSTEFNEQLLLMQMRKRVALCDELEKHLDISKPNVETMKGAQELLHMDET